MSKLNMLETLKNSDMTKISGELVELYMKGELGLDELLKDLPIFDTIYSMSKTIASVRDILLMKKVERFLFELKECSSEQRMAAIAEIEQSTPEFGESLIMVIDQCSDSKKPVILGRILAAYVRGEITLRLLHNLYYSVRMLDITLINTLRQFYDDKQVDISAQQHFTMCGLAEIRFARMMVEGFPSGKIKENETGKKLLEFL